MLRTAVGHFHLQLQLLDPGVALLDLVLHLCRVEEQSQALMNVHKNIHHCYNIVKLSETKVSFTKRKSSLADHGDWLSAKSRRMAAT